MKEPFNQLLKDLEEVFQCKNIVKEVFYKQISIGFVQVLMEHLKDPLV